MIEYFAELVEGFKGSAEFFKQVFRVELYVSLLFCILLFAFDPSELGHFFGDKVKTIVAGYNAEFNKNTK